MQVVEVAGVAGHPTIPQSHKSTLPCYFLLIYCYFIEIRIQYLWIVITQISSCVLNIVSKYFFYFFVLLLFLTLFTTDEKGVHVL